MIQFRLATPSNGPTWLPEFVRSIERALRQLAGRTSDTRTLTASGTLTTDDGSIFVDASGGAVTVALLPAASVKGRICTIKKIDASGNAVTIDPSGTETIDGATTQALSVQWASLTIQSDGAQWWIL